MRHVYCLHYFMEVRHGPYAITECKLNSFHIYFLRKLLGIIWREKVPSVDILRHCSVVSLQAILMVQIMLAWPCVLYGH